MKSFSNLRKFVTHLDRCKAKKILESNRSHLNEKHYRTISNRKELCGYSNKQLKQQLEIIKGTEGEECSVVGDTRSYSNRMIENDSNGATPGLLAPISHNGGEGHIGSIELGS